MNHLIATVRAAWNTKALRHRLLWAGLAAPAKLASMYLSEPAEYTAAAILAVSMRGE